jgi:hypothetical protein
VTVGWEHVFAVIVNHANLYHKSRTWASHLLLRITKKSQSEISELISGTRARVSENSGVHKNSNTWFSCH